MADNSSSDQQQQPVCPVCDKMTCPVCLANHFADDLRAEFRKLDQLTAKYKQLNLATEHRNLARMTFAGLIHVAMMRGELCSRHALPHTLVSREQLS